MAKVTFSQFIDEIKSYFNISADIEDQNTVETDVKSGVSFKGSQLLVLIFAIFIASLGLSTNNVPVIIGAMLISPLMGPIIGMGVAIGTSDYPLLRRSMKNILMAILGAVITSAIYFLISPIYGGSSQLLARTSPTIYDVFVGLFGGAAGILSIACKNKGQVMPGVAIATSLMPPLCTAGYGLATLQAQYFFGALYLFFINAIFILFAAWIGVKLMNYKKVDLRDDRRSRHIKSIITVCLIFTVALSVYLTILMIQKNRFLDAAQNFVTNQMVFPNTQVLNHSEYIQKGKRHIEVTLIGQELPRDSLQLAMMSKLDSVGLGGTILTIKQGYSIDTNDKRTNGEFYAILQNEIDRKQNSIDSLKAVIALRNSFSQSTPEVAPEVKVLFPEIESIALSRLLVTNVGENPERCDTLYIAFVNAPKGLNAPKRESLERYLSVRLKQDSIEVSVNPTGFPWNKERK